MNADLMIGAEARKFISERETNGLRQMRIDEFFSSIRTYFVTVCDYLIAKLPLQDEVLKRTEVAEISLQTIAKSADLVFFVNTFRALMPAGSTHDSLWRLSPNTSDRQSTTVSATGWICRGKNRVTRRTAVV